MHETFIEDDWEALCDRLAKDAASGCGQSHDLWVERYSQSIDLASAHFSTYVRSTAIRIAKKHGEYLSAAEMANIQASYSEDGFCIHGIDPHWCPAGCGDMERYSHGERSGEVGGGDDPEDDGVALRDDSEGAEEQCAGLPSSGPHTLLSANAPIETSSTEPILTSAYEIATPLVSQGRKTGEERRSGILSRLKTPVAAVSLWLVCLIASAYLIR